MAARTSARILPYGLAIALAIGCTGWCGVLAAQERAPARTPDYRARKFMWSYKELKQRNIVMQEFDYSCGAATLATIGRYYWGDDVNEMTFLNLLPELKLTEAEMRDRIQNGLTLTDLRDIANKAGYEASMGKVQFGELTKAKVPVVVGITVRGHDHFAVFRGSDGTYAYLADPIRGNVRTPVAEFLAQWQRNAILVMARPNTKVKDINPLGVRMSEAVRGVLTDQTVRLHEMRTPVPNPISVGVFP